MNIRIDPPLSPETAMQLMACAQTCFNNHKAGRDAPAIIFTDKLIDAIGPDAAQGVPAGTHLVIPDLVWLYGIPFVAVVVPEAVE